MVRPKAREAKKCVEANLVATQQGASVRQQLVLGGGRAGLERHHRHHHLAEDLVGGAEHHRLCNRRMRCGGNPEKGGLYDPVED